MYVYVLSHGTVRLASRIFFAHTTQTGMNSYEVIFENGSSTTGTSVDTIIGALRFRSDIHKIIHVWHHTREPKSFQVRHKLLYDRDERITFPDLERLLRNYGSSYM